jgi:hypothetical protein
MPIDTSIYSSLLRAPKSVADYDAEAQQRQQNALALQQGRQSLAMGQMKADEYTRGVQEQQQIRNALQGLGGAASDEQRIAALKGTGLPGGFAQADALEKTQQERLKTKASIGKTEAETAKDRAAIADAAIKRYRGALDFIDTPEGAARWMAAQYQDPSLAQHMSSMGPLDQVLQRIPSDPQGFQQWRQQAGMGMENYSRKLQEDAKIAETGRSNQARESIQVRGQDRQSADNAASRAVQMRGQNLTDARSREANTAAMSKPFEVTGPDGSPMLVRQDKAGNITPVAGYGPKAAADKPLTEGQAKAVAFAARMQASNKIINDLEEAGTSASIPGARAGYGVGKLINIASPESQQKLEQAKRDFINAILRRESGAVISDAEFANAEQQYFPQIGEGAAVRKQKAENRRIALDGMREDVPASRRPRIDEIAGGAKSPTGTAPTGNDPLGLRGK